MYQFIFKLASIWNKEGNNYLSNKKKRKRKKIARGRRASLPDTHHTAARLRCLYKDTGHHTKHTVSPMSP